MTVMFSLPFAIDPMTGSIVAFLAVFGAVAALVMVFQSSGTSNVENRLDVLAGKKAAVGGTSGSPQVTREALVKESMEGLTGLMAKLVERFANLKMLFAQADSNLKPETFALISLGLFGAGIGIGVVARVAPPLYPLIGLVMSLIPLWVLMFKRARRFKKFAGQLPQAMELIARALRSGHSLASALKVVVDELPDPISKEFNIAYEEQNLGIPLEQSLRNLYQRMPNMDYKFFATAVAIQRQSGGDLAEILDKIGHIIRDRFRIMGQVQALTGEGRISGIVLMALPILLFFAVWRLNPGYVMLLFTDELGRKMVAVAIVLQILGAVTINKIIAIKV